MKIQCPVCNGTGWAIDLDEEGSNCSTELCYLCDGEKEIMIVTEIKEGQFKGWCRTEAGDIFKQFGEGGTQNPTVWYSKGYFEVCDKLGQMKGTYHTLAEALEAVGINKK